MALQRLIRRKLKQKTIKGKSLLLALSSKEIFNDNNFFMSWEEFIKCFEIVFASVSFDDSWCSIKVQDHRSEKRSVNSTFYLESVGQNPQYLLVLPQATEVFFLLVHQSPVFKQKIRKVGFAIHKYEGKLVGEDGVKPSLVAIGRYSAEKVISLNCTLCEGQYVILVSTYEVEYCGPFTLTMWYPRKNCEGKDICLKRLNN
eukprot:TRINITY_DN10845_c0_g1_i1.p2 TRINITY_DN10845_c0_g1~~TRINITY_DN10845_c0_g1_i1.p2  ORF type:complete len:201 (-),score=45.22 TRINITY_DN10845_c0_g1_i1:157-759(-)